MVVIRGHKHLHQCAYIGDDSSEELDEMEANVAEHGHWPVMSVHDPNQIRMVRDQEQSQTGGSTNESNEPNRMRRVSPGVLFHGNQNPIGSHEKIPHQHDTEADYVDHIMLQLLQNIGRVKARIKGKDVTPKASVSAGKVSTEPSTNQTEKEEAVATSSEVFEDVLRRLKKLGDRGRSVLGRLNEQMGDMDNADKRERNGTVDLNTLRSIIREMLHEETSNRSKRGIALSSPSLHQDFNMHDEEKNAALEEVSVDLIKCCDSNIKSNFILYIS